MHAVDGRITIAKIGRNADLNRAADPAYNSRNPHRLAVWQNINDSPDFPTVARSVGGFAGNFTKSIFFR